jgi:iron complex transport system substrate-binding protein
MPGSRMFRSIPNELSVDPWNAMPLPRILFAPVLALALTVTGCATDVIGPGGEPVVGPSTDPEAPVTVVNCGVEVTFDEAPQRVVTIQSSTTEALIALGLDDRIVGTAYQNSPVPEQWADAMAGLVVVADRVPSQEVVLEREPDLVFAGWESSFTADGAGERADLTDLGVASYVVPSACQSADQPDPLTWEHVFGDLEELAEIFRIDASSLIAQQRAALANVDPVGDGRTALWFSSGSDIPFVGAGIGAPQLLMDTVGLTNIAGDVHATWAPFNWEAVVDADPDFIVLVDSNTNTAEKKIEVLQANPATAKLTAVREGRYLVLPFAATEAGVRSADAAASLAEQIAELDGR